MLTPQQAQDYDKVKQAMQACKPNLPVFHIKPIHGHENYTYYVNHKLVVRFFKTDFIEQSIRHQQKVLQFIAPQVPFRIGQFQIYHGEWNNAPLVMSISPRIDGYTLSNQEFRLLPRQNKQYIFDQLAEFMTALHRIDVKEAHRLQIPTLDEQLSRRLKNVSWLIPVLKAVKHQVEQGECITHNDLHSRNFHIDTTYRIRGIFDFDTLAIGAPVWDVSISHYDLKDTLLLRNAYQKVSNQELKNVVVAYYLRAFVEEACALQRKISETQQQKSAERIISAKPVTTPFLFPAYKRILGKVRTR